jgi:hypothetical protein
LESILSVLFVNLCVSYIFFMWNLDNWN